LQLSLACGGGSLRLLGLLLRPLLCLAGAAVASAPSSTTQTCGVKRTQKTRQGRYVNSVVISIVHVDKMLVRLLLGLFVRGFTGPVFFEL
jgi:hypothetical protein